MYIKKAAVAESKRYCRIGRWKILFWFL